MKQAKFSNNMDLSSIQSNIGYLVNQIKEELISCKKEFPEDFIVNRVATNDFFPIIKDSIVEHDSMCILCERIFKKSACSKKQVNVCSVNDETMKLIRDIRTGIDELKNDFSEEKKNEIQDLEKRLGECKPEISKIDIDVYRHIGKPDIVLTPFSNVPDGAIDFLSYKIAHFVYSFFSVCTLSPEVSTTISICIDRSNSEYIDILAVYTV